MDGSARRLARSVVLLAMIAVGLLLCLDVAYFVHGSLEWYPTDEQDDKVRTVTAVLAAALIAGELGLLSVLRYLSSGTAGRDRVADDASRRPPDGTLRSPRP